MARTSAKNLAALLLAGVARCSSGDVAAHFQFRYQDGLIEAKADPTLRLNVKGGALQAGDPVVLWPCSLHAHETFLMVDDQIRLQHNQKMCLNVEGGIHQGAKIITFPCSAGGARDPNEEFVMDLDGRIRVKSKRDMCINIKAADFSLGAELVLYQCGEDDSHNHDLFGYKDNSIFSKAKPDLHFNLKGGDLSQGGDIVLWTCHQSAHEFFDIVGTQIKIRGTDLCLHAEGGLGGGRPLIAWQCTKGVPGDNEQFAYDDARGVIYAVKAPQLAFNIKAANLTAGAEILLWELDKDEL